MRYYTLLFGMLLSGLNSQAQELASADDIAAWKREREQQLASKPNADTRSIDYKLALYNVKYPAKSILEREVDRFTLTFPLIEHFHPATAQRKAAKLKNPEQGIVAVNLDASHQVASITFLNSTSDEQVKKLLSYFLYDGYQVIQTKEKNL